MATKVIMPQLGESVVEGTVVHWFHQAGETVKEFDPLLEVTTDKLTTEIPSPTSGTVLKILVEEEATVRAGTVLAWLGEPGEVIPEEEGPAVTAKPQTAAAAATPQPIAAGRNPDLGFISPVVAKLARENSVDLTRVKGTGDGGRITKKDVLAYLAPKKSEAAPAPQAWETPADGDLFRPTEMMFSAAPSPSEKVPSQPPSAASPVVPQMPGDTLVPLTAARRLIAAHMVLSKHTSPHVTTVMEADMTAVMAHRDAHKAAFEQDGAHLTYTAYFAAVSVAALKAFPLVNSSWSEEGIVVHSAVNLGIAVSLSEEGLIVPVIKDADGLSLLGLARAVNDLAERTRTHHLQPDEIKNGTFTITNHGISGSLFAAPIINQPQCAILGVGAIQKRPVVIHDAIAIRSMVYLSLTFDHRILDGAIADHFLAKVVEGLEKWV